MGHPNGTNHPIPSRRAVSMLRLRLEARAPALRCHRAYEITVAQDLFGDWIVEMTYGRIGMAGRSKVRSFPGIEDAASAVGASLRRRATLPRRLGVAYRPRSVAFEPAWAERNIASQLTPFVDGRS